MSSWCVLSVFSNIQI